MLSGLMSISRVWYGRFGLGVYSSGKKERRVVVVEEDEYFEAMVLPRKDLEVAMGSSKTGNFND